MSENAAAPRDPWKVLHWIARINLVLGLFIWSRVAFELMLLQSYAGGPPRHFQKAFTIDFAMGVLSILSGGLLLRRHPKALVVSALGGGAIYANGFFGLLLSFPLLFDGVASGNVDDLSRTASFAAHFAQSIALVLFWSGVVTMFLGDLKNRRLEEVYSSHSRSAVLTCFATTASSMALFQILLRLFTSGR